MSVGLSNAYCQGCDRNLGTIPNGPDHSCDCGEAICEDCYEYDGVCRECEKEKLEELHVARQRLIKASRSLVLAMRKFGEIVPKRGESFSKFIAEKGEMDNYFPGVLEDIFGEEDYYGKKQTK